MRKALWTVAAAALGLAALAALVVWAPGILLNSRSAAWALRVLARRQHPSWRDLVVEVRSADLRNKAFHVRVEDFCFAPERGPVRGCFERLELRGHARLGAGGLRLTELSVARATGGRLRVERARRAAGKSAWKGLPAPLRGAKLGAVEIELVQLVVASPGKTARARGRLSKRSGLGEPLILEASLETSSARYRGRLRAVSDVLDGREPSYAELSADLRSGRLALRAQARARRAGERAALVSLDARAREGGRSLRLSASGSASERGLRLSGAAQAAGLKGLRVLALDPLVLTAARSGGSGALEAGFRVEPARGAGPAGVRLPDALVGRLRLSARRAPRRGAPDGFSAEASLELDPYASWYRLGGSLRASASGRLGDVKRARLRHEARLLLDVPRFEDLVSLLAGTPYAVPAPLHVLGGPLALALDSRGDTEGGRQALECRASADLRGGRQRLKLSLRAGAEGDGLPRRDASVRAEGELVVAEAALQLPHLELLKLPVVRLDERIKLARAETPAPAERGQWRDAARDVRRQAALDFRVRTATPAVIYSDLVRTPIPLMVDVQAASPPLAAGTTIEAGRFEAELFRRKCTVDHVRLVRRAGAKTAELDGLLLYKADEAAVRIRLLGTTEKPRVDLESDPPMRRDEILALLLYGKSPNELDPEQTSAVANTQEALSNEALGLLSLFILASTPVESVGYDPATRSYTMRLRLPGGATFELGSDFAESRQGQLRKRIASHFAIEAGVRSSVEQGSAVTTLLEWFGRY